jgi:hypothetical protein
MKPFVGITLALIALFGSSSSGFAQATGLTLNLPLVGRVIGGGNTLFRTAVDISNNTTTPSQVDFFFDGTDANTQQLIIVTGSIGSDGLRGRGQGIIRGRANVHFDDFVDSLMQAGMISAETRDHGVTGSLMVVFNGFTRAGQGAMSARFYNELAGGTVGVSLSAHEITTDEPQALVAVVRDTRTRSGPQLYTNMFINNTGLTRTGSPAGTVDIEVTAFANSSGNQVGIPMNIRLGSGQTFTISQVLTTLQAPSSEDTILVYARVTAGNAAIAGLTSMVDAVTRDGSVVTMSRAD